MLKKYKIGFDAWALLLFLVVMLPNFYWFAFEAPNDVLRGDSITPTIDMMASICQVVMVVALCMIKRRDVTKIKWSVKLLFVVLSYLVYLCSWIFYYHGNVNSFIIIALCLAPCLTFGFYAYDRKNVPVFIPLFIFGLCHLTFGIVNFIL